MKTDSASIAAMPVIPRTFYLADFLLMFAAIGILWTVVGLADFLLLSDHIMVINTSISSSLDFSTSSILFFITVFVWSTRPT